jgi:TusE/DsrC/DsvC family sulfur relay protein
VQVSNSGASAIHIRKRSVTAIALSVQYAANDRIKMQPASTFRISERTNIKEAEMLDINKSINDPNLAIQDPEGNMYELPRWSPEIAQDLALKDGLGELSAMQWRVIHTLRASYQKEGNAKSAHQILRSLAKDFATEGGGRYLYRLFPLGPVSQGSRLAGLPTPSYSGDPSFGSFS